MDKILIKDTTKQERIALIKAWDQEDELNDSGLDIWDLYKDYIDGKKEISECNAQFKAEYCAED